MEHVEQSSKDLHYELYDRKVDLSVYNILQSKKFELGNNDYLIAYILGASHALEFHLNGQILTEVFSCSDIKFENPIEQDKQHVAGYLKKNSDGKYWGYKFRQFTDDAVIFSTDGYMIQEFPDGSHTFISVQEIGNHHSGQIFRINTYHMYPKENVTVRTETCIMEFEE